MLKRWYMQLACGELFEHLKLSLLALFAGLLVVFFIPVSRDAFGVVWSFGLFELGANELFHLFHYPHITFACATAFLTLMRYSRSLPFSLVVSLFVPPIFCTLSDILLPYWGGKVLGVNMMLHLCFFCGWSPIAFVALGIALGLAIYYRYGLAKDGGHCALHGASLWTHFLHEFVSAIASIVYFAGFGFFFWYKKIFLVSALMFVCVIIPCVLSDFVLPVALAKLFRS